MSFHDDDQGSESGLETDVSLARSRTTEAVDSSIVKAVEEIDGVLEEMRELSMLRGMSRMRTDDSQSEMSSDVNGHGNDIDLALELNLADESFRKNQHRLGNLPPTNAYFHRNESEDEDEDIDSPIAVSIGEQTPPATNRSWKRIVDNEQSNVIESKEKQAKNERRNKKRSRLLRISLLLMTVGALIILVTALLVVKRANDSSTTSSAAGSQFNSAVEAANKNLPGLLEVKTEEIPTPNPSSTPTTQPTRTPTVSPTRRPTRFPSIAPVAATELPTLSNVSSGSEGEIMEGDEDGEDYYYHETEKEKSKKGKGSSNVLRYRDWE